MLKRVILSLGMLVASQELWLQDAQAQAKVPSEWGGISASVSVTNDFRHDGISRSNNDPALQGTIYWWRPDGFFVGAFATSVDFGPFIGATYELDLYAGKNFTIRDTDGKTDIGLMALYTTYPDNAVPDFLPDHTFDFLQTALTAHRTTGALKWGGRAAWSPDASFTIKQTFQIEADGELKINDWLTTSARYGRRWADNGQDRSFWDVGAKATYQSLDLDVRYTDTDLSALQCGHLPETCKPGMAVTLTWRLPTHFF